MSLGSGIDLGSLLSNTAFTPTPQTQQAAALVTAAKSKKKTPTADQKRTKLCLNVLQGKDTYGLDYCNLVLAMPPDELEKFAIGVKAAHNIA